MFSNLAGNVFKESSSEAQRILASYLLDENVHVLTSFELNQIATLTYGDEICGEIFDMLDEILSDYVQYSPLCLQKTLILSRHILIYGADRCVKKCWGLARYGTELMEYNTVFIAQRHQGALAMFHRIQGGSVDKGYPVREAAKSLFRLLGNSNEIQRLRHTNADPNSLVPVGDKNKAAFVSDEVRFYLLQRRMKEQQATRIKSNIVKSESSFGGGLNTQSGKRVVGAAHGIEEMLKMEERAHNRYRDDGRPRYERPRLTKADFEPRKATTVDLPEAPPEEPEAQSTGDLLFGDSGTPSQAKEVDLLGFGGEDTTTSATPGMVGDLLGSGSNGLSGGEQLNLTSSDLLGIFDSNQAASTQSATSELLGMSIPQAKNPAVTATSSDLLNVMGANTETVPIDPFSPQPSAAAGSTKDDLLSLVQPANQTKETAPIDPFSPQALAAPPMDTPANTPMVATKKSIMENHADRFAALDALADSSSLENKVATMAAEKRILGMGASRLGAFSMGTSSMGTSSMGASSMGTSSMGASSMGAPSASQTKASLTASQTKASLMSASAAAESRIFSMGATAAAAAIANGARQTSKLNNENLRGVSPEEQANTEQLQKQIADLQRQLHALEATKGSNPVAVGAMGGVSAAGGGLSGLGSLGGELSSAEISGSGLSSGIGAFGIPQTDTGPTLSAASGFGTGLGGSQNSAGYGVDEADEDSGFVMGGTIGSGLEPLGPAPAAPPPPPPP